MDSPINEITITSWNISSISITFISTNSNIINNISSDSVSTSIVSAINNANTTKVYTADDVEIGEIYNNVEEVTNTNDIEQNILYVDEGKIIVVKFISESYLDISLL